MSNLAEGDEEEAHLEEEQEAKLAEMDAEMEKEKEARKLAGATDAEIQQALELLQKQHEAKRKVKIRIPFPFSEPLKVKRHTDLHLFTGQAMLQYLDVTDRTQGTVKKKKISLTFFLSSHIVVLMG